MKLVEQVRALTVAFWVDFCFLENLSKKQEVRSYRSSYTNSRPLFTNDRFLLWHPAPS